MKNRRKKTRREEKEREPLPYEDIEDSEAYGYESSGEMDLEDEEE